MGLRRVMLRKVAMAKFQIAMAGAAQMPMRWLYENPERINSLARTRVQ